MEFNLPQTRAQLEHQRMTAEAALHALGTEIEIANRKREICRTNLIAITAQLALLEQMVPKLPPKNGNGEPAKGSEKKK
jgi:hypothetical protein